MSLTLLVENNPKVESVYVLNLSTWAGLEPMTKKRAEFVINYLEARSSEVKLIITRSFIDKEPTAQLILDYLALKNLQIPVIVYGPSKDTPKAFAHVPNSLDLKAVIKASAAALGITAQEMMRKVVPDYFPIPITYFLVIPRPVCQVYSRDLDDQSKYNLRIEKNQTYENAFIEDMIREGVDFLFVDKLNRLEFVNNVTSELISIVEDTELSEDEQLSANERGVELLTKKLLSIGLTEETIKLADKNMASIRAQVSKNPKLSKLMDRLVNNKASYLYKHTQILTYVALHLVSNIEWGTPEQQDKISFVAFFHDIALGTDDQARIHSSAELKKSTLTPEDRSLVEKHAMFAAEIVVRYPHAPMGADQIIRQHHGQLNGIGFSEYYGANISPMAVVFIVAEEFTRILLKNNGTPINRPEMFQEMKAIFPTQRFVKMLDILQSITF